MSLIYQWIWLALLFSPLALATGFRETHRLETNAAVFPNAPMWLRGPRAERVIDRIQTKLEWTIRRIQVQFYDTPESFAKAQNLGPGVLAVTKRRDTSVHLGPKVTTENFDQVFGHELVHVILAQKYKDAIPPWLEEGLANHLARMSKPDYAWLARQPFPTDVRVLGHPFENAFNGARYHYQASQALAEMIARKCDLENLLRLSVERKLEDYLRTYCEIKDLNGDFQAWVKKKAG